MTQRAHVPDDRLKGFILSELKLTETEHDHVVHCAHCITAMAEAVLSEIRKAPPEAA